MANAFKINYRSDLESDLEKYIIAYNCTHIDANDKKYILDSCTNLSIIHRQLKKNSQMLSRFFVLHAFHNKYMKCGCFPWHLELLASHKDEYIDTFNMCGKFLEKSTNDKHIALAKICFEISENNIALENLSTV